MKLFVATLFSDEQVLAAAENQLTLRFGSIDFEGRDHAFDTTDYYAEEMGTNLRRRIVAFSTLSKADELPDAKIICTTIEKELSVGAKRRVNLDVGYIDACKVILASCKGLGQKIYLRRGVWADFVCRYKRGTFETFEWTFPDFADGRYNSELAEIRKLFLAEQRSA